MEKLVLGVPWEMLFGRPRQSTSTQHRNPPWVLRGEQVINSMCNNVNRPLHSTCPQTASTQDTLGWRMGSAVVLVYSSQSSETAARLDVVPTLPLPESRHPPLQLVHTSLVLSFIDHASPPSPALFTHSFSLLSKYYYFLIASSRIGPRFSTEYGRKVRKGPSQGKT